VPCIGIPTRLRHPATDADAAAAPVILAEASCAPRLRFLERLFPGIVILEIGGESLASLRSIRGLIEGTTLVVDAKGRLPRLALACALRGVNFLGKSPLWPRVPGRTWLGRARYLLTDFAFSKERAAAALARARAHAARIGRGVSQPSEKAAVNAS